MGRACCVLGCPSGGNVPSHQFPKDPILARKWRTMIYSEKVQHLTDEQIKKCAVCYRHFADDDYLVTYRVRKLKRGVAPSLNLPNNFTVDSSKINVIREDPRTEIEADTSTNASFIKMETESEETEVETLEIKPDLETCYNIQEADTCLPEHSQQFLSNNDVNETDSVAETFKSYCRLRALRRKRAKLTAEQLALLRRKKQADTYAKTPTIQKLLSYLTPAQKSSIQTKIRKSRYSPKVYINVYHDIAKRKALNQL